MPKKIDLPVNTIVKLYDGNTSSVRIAEHFGVSSQTILHILHQNGCKIRNSGAFGFHKHSIKIPTDSALLGYLAGLVDGEGHITFIHANGQKTLMATVGIANTNKDVIDFLLQTVGGTITIDYRSRQGHKDCYHWKLRVIADVKLFLDAILPYLIIKRRNAESILDWCNQRLPALGIG